MAHRYEELHKMTVAQLREIAAGIEHEAVRGHTQLNKEQLLPALCQALALEAHAHHQVTGIDKAEIKAKIHALRAERDAALEAHDHVQLKRVRRRLHRLKRAIRRATV